MELEKNIKQIKPLWGYISFVLWLASMQVLDRHAIHADIV